MIKSTAQLFVALTLLVLCSHASAHRQHFSWTSVIWQAQSQSLQITHRVHQYDAAQLLNFQAGHEIDITDLAQQAKYALYVAAHFELYVGNEKQQAKLIGAELDGHYLLVFQELNLATEPTQLGFRSTILMDLIDNQINIVDLEIGSWNDTINFNKRSKQQTLSRDIN